MTNLVDLVALSCGIPNKASFLDVLGLLKKEFMISLKNQANLSYSEIVTDCYASKQYPFSNPSFQLFFNFIEIEFSSLVLPDCRLNLVEELTSDIAQFKFHFEIRYDRIRAIRMLNVVSAQELFSSETVAMVENIIRNGY